jgi:localization factor PodJL
MRPDIPWNVAGIPPEAREAARAAARREGLSVGEWVTRKILRSFSETPDDMTPAREQWTSNGNGPSNGSLGYGSDQRPVASRRDTDDMLARVAKSESDSNDVYRRIEEQLRSVARRLESTERNQTENNRAMSKAASEINVAAREQAQAFDQLGGSVVSLADRLERVERSSSNDGTRDAIKGLHQGLSRLADQISNTAGQSATQISSLANNLEALAARLAQARSDSEHATQNVGQRVVDMDHRLGDMDNRLGDRVAEMDHHLAQLDQRMSHVSAIDERLRAVERATQASNDVLTHAVQSIEARKDEEAVALRRDADTASAIARLEDNLSRLDNRGPDPGIDRRLSGIERSLTDIITRFSEPAGADAIEDNIKRLAQRMDAAEQRQRDQIAELRTQMERPAAPAPQSPFAPAPQNPFAAAAQSPFAPSAAGPFAPAEMAPPPLATAPNAPFGMQTSFEAPPFVDPADHAALHASADPFAAAPAFDPAAGGFDTNAFNLDPFATSAAPPPVVGEPETFLTAARRSARAAAAQAEAERGSRAGGFSWGAAAAAAPQGEKAGSKKTLMWIAIIAVVTIAAIAAGAMLSRNLSSSSGHTISMMFPKAQGPAAATPADASVRPTPAADAPVTTTTKPMPSAMKPLVPHVIKPAPVHAVPGAPVDATVAPPQTAPAQTKPVQTASVAPLDKLTQLANAGNAKAELVVGLKYLDGDGVPVNEADAAKWLERAAEAGAPVAQYRLGTMYEHGRGVPADAAKAVHWYEIAAQAGNRKAMHNLAVAYASGQGTAKNLPEAARWFSKAASLGLADSEFNLAVLYERGLGVPQSLIDAYKWYAIAAAAGDAESKNRIDALSTQLSNDDRAAAQRAAESFKPGAMDPRANVAPQMSDVAG